jgi:ADP-ribose pyrophosphatase YjhB (NUDIX family)
VYALVVVRRPSDGAFLMVQEFAQQGYWVPGGGVDTGEGLRAAALRETREEAGVEVELKGVLQVSWGHRYRYRRVIFYAEPVGDAGPHLQEGAATAAAAAATAVGLTGGVSSSSRAVDGLEQASKAEAAAAGGAVAGHGAGDLVCPGRVVPHHVAPTLPQAVALAQQQLQQRGAAGGDGGRPSAPAVVPKTLPDFESAGACWVRLEDLGRVPLRSKEVPLTWFPHVAAGGAMEPMVQPECWQQVFEGWEW